MSSNRLYSDSWSDYELIDAGGSKKLERWGDIITIRPEINAYFKSEKPFSDWREIANWEFISKDGRKGKWISLKEDSPETWSVAYHNLCFNLKITQNKHIGLFPEQRTNWDFLREKIAGDSKFLNLFAYTGAASCVIREIGAETMHVDSVKQLISWAKTNMEASSLQNIKWVHEDALKFARREVKRNHLYDGIIMDPPAWGIGTNREKWKLEDQLEDLISTAAKLLSKKGVLVLNTYSPKVDHELIEQLSNNYLSNKINKVSELWMKSSTGKDLFYGNLLRTF